MIITLLNLPLSLSPGSPAWTPDNPDLFTGLADYVRRCKETPTAHHVVPRNRVTDHAGQTFEGGISGKPDAEAHGAYAFCALGCLAILDAPHHIFPRSVPSEAFYSCSSGMYQ